MKAFQLHPEATHDIEDYLSLYNAVAAGRLIEDITAQFRTLAATPGIDHMRPDLSNRALRFISVRDHLIAYAPQEKPLLIVAVVHGRRNPYTIAAMLRDREGQEGQ